MPKRTLTGSSVLQDLSFSPPVEDGVSFDDCTLPIAKGTQTASKLGLLSKLPLELAQEIFLMLDIPSINNLLSISPEAHRILVSIPQYRKISTHVPHFLRALAQVHSAPHLTIKYLCDDLLARKSCSNCEAFAGYYSLLSDKRTCKTCIAADDEFEAWNWEECSPMFNLEETLQAGFKCVRPVQGRYYGLSRPDEEYVPKTGEVLVSAVQVRSKAGESHGQFREELMFQNWLSSHPAGEYRPRTLGNRFACAVRIPWFRQDGEVEWGVGCKLCLNAVSNGFRLQASNPWSNVLFSKTGFKEHLENECRYMHDLEEGIQLALD